ncbi:MAG: filamentous hemagglutinin N-terminal domain-containing protein [Piscinibacter sp.]|nr:filamentous hemagglutinin N-terminal domain-containing protein [Piscinibacter sp.]
MKRNKVFLVTPLAWAAAAAVAQTAALPTGGVVTQGSGSISSNGTAMVVQQNSARMVADWQSFSIGAGNSVRFVQPGSDSVALNRVIGGDPSAIFGSLTANGHVYLQNPNGVLFAPGSQVNVGALVATTLNADVGQFLAGNLRLSGSGGVVRNEGSLQAAPGGYVVLAAPQVSNAGSIVAPGGTAALAAGSAVEIDPTGSGLLSIRVPTAAVAAKLENSGSITADGGLVALQAAATDAALNTVMQVGGVVRARSIEQRNGVILLSGGPSGVVQVDGTLDASGGAGLSGGAVSVLGERVGLLGSATIDASGDIGGGTVLVGGNLQGRGPEPNAQVTVIGPQASIDVSAGSRGDGGTAIVWSDQATTFQGRVSARGGAEGGDGGFAEVSGKQTLNFLGEADLSAPAGERGTLLLDPSTLIVGTQADVNGDGVTGDDLVANVLFADPQGNFASQITANRVATLLATNDVLLQATFQISVTAPLTVAAGGAATTLTLNAESISIGSAVTLNNSSLVADTANGFSDSISINAPLQSLNSVSLASSSIGINNIITAGQVSITSSGFVTEATTGGLVANQVSTFFINEGSMDLSLTSANNRIGLLALEVGNANVRVDNAAGTPMNVQGTVFGDLTLTAAGGGLAQVAGAGGALSVSADTQIITVGGVPAVLDNTANQFFGPVDFATTGSISLGAQGPLTLTGRGAGDVRVNVVGGTLTLGTAGINTTGTLIDLTSAGFIDASDTGNALLTGAGGRFFIRSSNAALDDLGAVALGAGAADINHVLLAGWTGATPAAGNVYVTNATGAITTAPADQAPVTKVYDGSTAFTYTQTGTAAGGTTTSPATALGPTLALGGYTVTADGTFADKNVGTDKAYAVAASTNVVATGSGGEQYYGLAFGGFNRAAGPGIALSSVTPRALTSTGITGVDRVYDATTAVGLNTTGATLNNVVAGDTVTLSTTGATGAMVNKNVGAGKAVAVTGLALVGTDAGNYTVADASNPTVNITPRPISASGVTAVDRVYDGTTVVALNTAAAALTGVLAGDTVTLAGGTGTMADKNVGVAKPVTGTVTLGGADGGNYLATPAAAPTVTITTLAITSTGITAVDRAYDGTTAVALDGSTATLAGAIAGDALTLSTAGATGTMADKNVGTAKPVAISGVTLAGADAVNYSLTDASNATVNISALTLQATGIRAVNRVVDGTTVVELDTDGAALPGVLAGDSVVLDASGAVGAVSSPDPGLGKPVSVSGIVLGGADAANYAVSPLVVGSDGQGLTVRILTVEQGAFEDVRFTRYLQGVSDAQEPFRRAMAEALAAGFGKENIRKQLSRGLVFETGLAAPAVDNIDSAARPASCTAGGGANAPAIGCR